VRPSGFIEVLKGFQSRFERELDRHIPAIDNSEINEAMRYAALDGGKRLRPFLLVNTAQIFDASSEAAWSAAVALECVHVYSLIHDDLPCMDDDDLRRGRPTVHKAYDEAVAVLAGDGLLTLAFEILSDLNLTAEIKIELISNLAQAAGTKGMIGGQGLDIRAEGHQQTIQSISKLLAMKTGALIRYAALAGGKIGGADEKQQVLLEDYASDLGLLFQITDDILDVTGDATQMGKAVGKDKNLGKATFVSILGLSGAKEKATLLAGRAKSRLEPFGQKAHILSDIVDYVLNREH